MRKYDVGMVRQLGRPRVADVTAKRGVRIAYISALTSLWTMPAYEGHLRQLVSHRIVKEAVVMSSG